jgi:hypothetical protein
MGDPAPYCKGCKDRRECYEQRRCLRVAPVRRVVQEITTVRRDVGEGAGRRATGSSAERAAPSKPLLLERPGDRNREGWASGVRPERA